MSYPGLVLTRTVASGKFERPWLLPTPFSPDNLLRRSDARETSCLPIDADVTFEIKRDGLSGQYGSPSIAEVGYDMFTMITDLLISGSSFLLRTQSSAQWT